MNKLLQIFGVLFIGILGGSFLPRISAQSSPTVAFEYGVANVAACAPLTPAAPATFCFTLDGNMASAVGSGPFTCKTCAVAAGVTSFNGRSGAVMPVASDYPFPASPVTSVNGKLGAVVITLQ